MIRHAISLCLWLMAALCPAQQGQTASIIGTVTERDGKTLPGTRVKLESPALVYPAPEQVTGAAGAFRFLSLPPGRYRLTFTAGGMEKITRPGIIVNTGKIVELNIVMRLAKLKKTVVVTGDGETPRGRPVMGTTVLKGDALDLLPMTRRLPGYAAAAPGVTADEEGKWLNGHGSGDMENAFLLDGVNVGDPATGGNYVTLGMDILEELSVKSGALPAEYGGVKGTVVNIVTRSGGPRWNAGAGFYFAHRELSWDNTGGTPQAQEGKNGLKFRYEPVLTLGGPLLKNRLSLFAVLGMSRQEIYVPGYPHDEAEPVPTDTVRLFPYLKLTFEPDPRNRLVFSYNYSDVRSNHHGAGAFYNTGTTRRRKSPAHVLNGQWTHFFNRKWYGWLKLAMVGYRQDLRAKQPGTDFLHLVSRRHTGSYWRNRDAGRRDRFQVNLGSVFFVDRRLGAHEVKWGGQLQWANVEWQVEFARHPVNGTALAVMWPEYYGEPGWVSGYVLENFHRKERMVNASVYFQDSWAVNRRLTLNLGIRFDVQGIIWPRQNVDEEPFRRFGLVIDRRIPQPVKALNWKDLSPRFGFGYDMLGNGKWRVYGSWGRYVQPNQVGWVNEAHPNGWYGYRVGLDPLSGAVIPGSEIPLWTPNTTHLAYPGEKLKAPSLVEWTLGMEWRLGRHVTVGMRYIKKWDRDLLHIVDASRLDMETLLRTGKLKWLDYEAVELYDPFSGEVVTFWNDMNVGRVPDRYILNAPGAGREYDGFELTVKKRFSKGWSLDVSYVYGHSRGLISTARDTQSLGTSGLFNDPNYHTHAYGRFLRERRHQLKFLGLLQGPWGVVLGLNGRCLSGGRYTRQVSSDYLGNKPNVLNQGNITINAEPKGARGLPDRFILDLRIEKVFPWGKGCRLRVFGDMFNLFNVGVATDVHMDSSHPLYTFGQPKGVVESRSIRLGIKAEFH